MVSLLMSLDHKQNKDILGGVVFTCDFPDNASLPHDLSYKIRLTYSPRNAGGSKKFSVFFGDNGWKTQLTFPLYQRVGPRERYDGGGGDPGTTMQSFGHAQALVNYFKMYIHSYRHDQQSYGNIKIYARNC